MKKRVKIRWLMLSMSLAFAVAVTGCSKLKKPEETEPQTVTEAQTQTEEPTESETEPQTELQKEIAYISQDKSIQITLPDSTWKVTQDADEMRVFSSGADAMISIVHAANESQMKNISVYESEDALTEGLTKQYPSANAFEVVDFKTSAGGGLTTREYVVKYNATSMWAYSVVYGILAEKEAYVIQGTVTDDNKVLLDAVQKSVESFTVLQNPVFQIVQTGNVLNQTEGESEGEKTAEGELKTLKQYGTQTTLYASDTVNIRSTPSTESGDTVIGTLSAGEKVTVVGETSKWFQVNINGNIGYVNKAYLVKNSPSGSQTNAPAQAETPAGENDRVNAEKNSQVGYDSPVTLYTTSEVNVRLQPGTDSGVVDVLGNGQAVQTVGETDNWFVVSIGGVTGYISKSYLSYTNPGGGSAGNNPPDVTPEDPGSSGGGSGGETTPGEGGGGQEGSGTGTASNPGTLSGTITSTSLNGIVITADDGNIYSIDTQNASVSSSLSSGQRVSVNVDYANTLPNGDLYATSVTGQ